jgi:lactoylglutathione lyase
METLSLVSKIDCVRLSVPNLESGLAFYKDGLGFQVKWRSDKSVGLGMPDTDAELVLHIEDVPVEVDFLVASADRAAIQYETAGGKIVEGPFDIAVGRCVVVQDPWGNEYVLLDLSKGPLQTDIDGNVLE